MNSHRPLPTLMMVDDDQNDAMIFVRRLKDAGVENPVLHFRNGGEAFVYLKQFCVGDRSPDQCPCMMFLDVNMPSLSGFDLLAWARHQPVLQHMKIIMLSGATEPWDAKIAEKLGADDYLMKFPDRHTLADRVAAHIPAFSTADATAVNRPRNEVA